MLSSVKRCMHIHKLVIIYRIGYKTKSVKTVCGKLVISVRAFLLLIIAMLPLLLVILKITVQH